MYIKNVSKPRWPKSRMGLCQLAVVVPLFCGILEAYSSGPPPRYSGAPGDNLGSCTSCHRGLAVNGGQGSVKILLPNGNSYMPGVTQHIMGPSTSWSRFPILNSTVGASKCRRG